jgi:hypothetical protein
MEDNISFVCQDEIKNKIDIITRQTNYTELEASDKLKDFNYDHIKVIKHFLGIPEKKEKITSVNQEIYKQLRLKLDKNMREFNHRKEKSETSDLNNV